MKQITNSNQVRCSVRKLKNTGVYGDILTSVRSILVRAYNPYMIMELLNGELFDQRLSSLKRFLYNNDTNETRRNVISQTIL